MLLFVIQNCKEWCWAKKKRRNLKELNSVSSATKTPHFRTLFFFFYLCIIMNPEYSETGSNKRQKPNEQAGEDANDFLNFDYEFPIVNQTEVCPESRIPEDFFMFVTDNANTTLANTPSPKPLKKADPPNQAVYTIVVGGKPFRLSWESLKSDGPTNFFLEYFRKKKTKVMHIDRDADIFELIVRHLRGYYIRSVDDIQNQSLLFDANYFGLNRLKKILQEYLYLNVGGRVFRLPWTLFQKGLLSVSPFHTALLTHVIRRVPQLFYGALNALAIISSHRRKQLFSHLH